MRNQKIVFFAPYPFGEAPSQRFRFEQYFSLLKERGCDIVFYSFFNKSGWSKLYTSTWLTQAFWLIVSVVRTFLRVPLAVTADFVFVHREVMPIGPPIAEWLIKHVLRKKIIYDFDDAIWMTDKTKESVLERIIRWRSKVGGICTWSYKVSCGNQYLADFAQQFNANVLVNPTTIDTEEVHNPTLFDKHKMREEKKISGVVIGWTGSHSTLKYLEEIEPVLIELENQNPEISLVVIADKPPQLKLKRLLFYKWSKETEIKNLMLVDIGIMPLPNDQWAKGKCGFKALQYMALGIPTVVSPIGVNTTIIQHGENGFCCSAREEWREIINLLVKDDSLRAKTGNAGKQTVLNHYSVKSNSDVFLSLFQ